ncbi:MAG: DUF6364 family protein [Bacteroidota bacterium]
MKTKLTLTINKQIIDSAKRAAKKRNISLSQLFEEIFSQDDLTMVKTESQKAAERLLRSLSLSESIENKRDEDLLRQHISKKYG